MSPLTNSEIPEAEPWDRAKSGGKSLKEIALKHGWVRLAPGTYHDASGTGKICQRDGECDAEE